MATTQNPSAALPLLSDVIVASTSDVPLHAGNGIPAPTGAVAGPVNTGQEPAAELRGIGIEGEVIAWQGRYSMRNFFARLAGMALLSMAWVILAFYTWPGGHGNLVVLAWATGIVVLVLWLALVRRIILARFGHSYQLTNRRIFATTGVFERRRDQIELLRVQDVYLRQNFLSRWLGIGTVVVVSSEQHFPIMYLTGVDDPKAVMDLIWHHARAERDVRSVKIDQI
jgi:membrane protein YdbS with pleckstrin-like domain